MDVEGFFEAIERVGENDAGPITAMGIVDPAYLNAGGPARVTFDGEVTLSAKAYQPVGVVAAGNRVLLVRSGHTWVIIGTLNGGSGRVADTRSVSKLPSFYKQQVTWEFKAADALSMPSSWVTNNGGYVALETISAWTDNSGGGVVQRAYLRGSSAIRGENGAASNYAVRDSYAYRTAAERRVRVATRVSRTDIDAWSTWYLEPMSQESSGVHHINNDSGGLNASYAAGFYECPPGTTGAPTADWCTVTIERHSNNNTNAYITQTAKHFFTTRTWTRRCLGGDPTLAGSWTTWRQTEDHHQVPDTWQQPVTTAPWQHYAGNNTTSADPHAPLKYRKLASGLVILQGLAQTAGGQSVIYTLPAGFRPSVNLIQATWASVGVREMRVDTAGNINAQSGEAFSWYSTAMTFMATD